MTVTGDYARFSSWSIDLPGVVTGAHLDVVSARASYRLYPFRAGGGVGLHVGAGAGLLVARDRIALELPARTVESTDMRFGFPLEVEAGWTFGRHIDLSLRHTLAVFTEDQPRTFRYWALALGGHL
ncbi:hypothetical protein [Pendulispora albinea]|uniref:Outer membrane protein beta-barrel domain-containing protein n=1 Tax=Pendulispora albinea TaxID=2741071 RepID=A0ABZ2M7Q7_9BACT